MLNTNFKASFAMTVPYLIRTIKNLIFRTYFLWLLYLDVCNRRVGCEEGEASKGLHKSIPFQLQVEYTRYPDNNRE